MHWHKSRSLQWISTETRRMISVDLKRAVLIDMIRINAKIIDATVICEHMKLVLPLLPKDKFTNNQANMCQNAVRKKG